MENLSIHIKSELNRCISIHIKSELNRCIGTKIPSLSTQGFLSFMGRKATIYTYQMTNATIKNLWKWYLKKWLSLFLPSLSISESNTVHKISLLNTWMMLKVWQITSTYQSFLFSVLLVMERWRSIMWVV